MSDRKRVFSGAKVKQARLAIQMSRLRFGRLIGRSDYSVWLWETGRCIPKADSLMRISEALCQPIEYFYE